MVLTTSKRLHDAPPIPALPKFIYKCNHYHLSIVNQSETQLRGPDNLYSLRHSGAANFSTFPKMGDFLDQMKIV